MAAWFRTEADRWSCGKGWGAGAGGGGGSLALAAAAVMDDGDWPPTAGTWEAMGEPGKGCRLGAAACCLTAPAAAAFGEGLRAAATWPRWP
mmetsp:Transcript_81062/g.181367  ORF Transcript_81062/g.181367 Transcript_81062/m.181367 type:complete len:91 (+) Transcript_81062:77-349(+)